MAKKGLITELSAVQLDELLAYTPAFSAKNLANIKARSLEAINHEEKPIMKKSTVRRYFSSAIAACLALLILSATAFAAWHFLRPNEVAQRAGDTALSAAFESESAININQSITSGDYIFTLLAIVSGEDITDHPIYSSTGEILRDRTYAVLAIQQADGSPMPSPQDAEYEPFIVSPFVRGISPWQANIFTLGGGQHAMVVDGILYIIVDCNDITMFAGKGVYLGVSSGGFSMFELIDAFTFNEQTGEITVSPYSGGSTVIFEIPFDKTLADPERVELFLNEIYPTQSSTGNYASGLDAVPYASQQSNPLRRMDYETLRTWVQEEMARFRASGNYSESVLASFEQDHTRMLDAIRDGFYFYMNDDGSFWQAIKPDYVDSGIGFGTIP